MMKRLNMTIPGGKTFFQATHYKNYLDSVIKVNGVQEIIEELRKHKDKDQNLPSYFKSIDDIIDQASKADEPDS